MPLTPSHAAAVLPLARTRLPLDALVIGSMVPDVPLFAGWSTYHHTHSIAGVLSTDIVMGVVVLLVWRAVLRRPTLRMLPSALAARWPRPMVGGPPGVGWVLVALMVGAATHAGWDHCTHAYGVVVNAVPVLQEQWPLVGIKGYRVMQNFSSVFGAVVIVAWFRRRPRLDPIASPLTTDGLRYAGWAALVGGSVATSCLQSWLSHPSWQFGAAVVGSGKFLSLFWLFAALVIGARLARVDRLIVVKE